MNTAGFPDDALEVRPIIEPESGRWVVFLEVLFVPDREPWVVRHRVRDFATEEQAAIAARWMVGAAQRNLPRPPLGF